MPIALGACGLLKCVWDFAAIGRGTLSIVDPPRKLVVRGLYRYVRNPMYVSVLTIVFGEALFFQSKPLLQYALGCLLAVHLIVTFYEEPTLRRRFGESYVDYCRAVRRWLPGKRFEPKG